MFRSTIIIKTVHFPTSSSKNIYPLKIFQKIITITIHRLKYVKFLLCNVVSELEVRDTIFNRSMPYVIDIYLNFLAVHILQCLLQKALHLLSYNFTTDRK